MKKFFALLLCLLMVVSMVACDTEETKETKAPAAAESDKTAEGDNTPATPAKGDTMSLTEILDGIYAGYNEELPMLETINLTDPEIFDQEMFTYTTYATYVEGMEAAISQPPMSAIAHCVVLVRVPEGTDAETVRAEIEQNHDPMKWVCVTPEKTAVIAHNNTIMLVMSTEALADVVIANFDALWA